MAGSNKLRIKLLYDLEFPPYLDVDSQDWITHSNGCMTPIFTAACSTITKIWNQLRCPTKDQWIIKVWNIYMYVYIHAYIHLYDGILCRYKEWCGYAIHYNMNITVKLYSSAVHSTCLWS